MLCRAVPCRAVLCASCRGVAPVSSLAEQAYDQYLRLMFREQEPELVITLPQQQEQQPQQQEEEAAKQPGEKQEQPAGSAAAAPAEQENADATAAAGTPAKDPAAAAAPADGAAAPTPAPAAPTAAAAAADKPGQAQLKISILFSKPAGSFPADTSLLSMHNCMVANPLLRRSRALFPCVDSPLYLYTPGAPHYLPYTFDLHVTVPPSCMAVCSGVLLQQSCTVAPRPQHNGSNRGHAFSAGGGDSGEEQGVVVARTFEYAVTAPVVPAQLSIAVGPFVAIPYEGLLAAGGSGAVALPDHLPTITVFTLRPPKTLTNGSSSSSGRTMGSLRKQGTAGGAAAGGAAAGEGGAGAAGGLGVLDQREVLQLADTLRPLAVLLGSYNKLLTCSLPWSHLQVAVVPDGCMLTPWQVREYAFCVEVVW